MRVYDLIRKKRDGEELSGEEIRFLVLGYSQGEIPDYQMSAFTMAVFFQGMSPRETSDLTMAMVESGDRVDLSGITGIKVDKHSTGGVGDKVSLIVAPLAANVGVPVAKMSGRGLGHTGGTIDKLESIPGFQVELSIEEFIQHVNTYRIAIVGQSGNLVPADKKLYALRDVTATVDSVPLIASSIMSKKIASGADAIVLDVKFGTGAFMKTLDEARILAQTMVEIGNKLGRRTVAILSDMNQPLGHEIGNANEVKEALEVLRGQGPKDLREVSLTLAAHMTVLGGVYATFEAAYQELERVLSSGRALQTFKQFIEAQGGDPLVVDEPQRLPQATHHVEVLSDRSGYVTGIQAENVGVAAMMLGAGRAKKEDVIDHAAGITLLKKVGDQVELGDTIALLHCNVPDWLPAKDILQRAYTIKNNPPAQTSFLLDTVE